MIIREKRITFRGKELSLVGDRLMPLGDRVPELKLSKSVEEDVSTADFNGRIVVFNVIPSIDTPVCSKQTTRFNEEAKDLGDGVAIVTVSMDLPFAIQRWCELQRALHITATSDYKYQDFGRNFAVLIQGMGILARSIFIVDPQQRLIYEEIVTRIEEEPNYDAALAAVERGLTARG